MRLTYPAAAIGGTALVLGVAAQTEDTIWHNRYHAVLAMAAYGNYNQTCQQVFTRAAMLRNFPSSTLPPWEVLETFGPTPSGAEGFTVMIREMDKVVLVFKGDYSQEVNLSTDVTSWDALGLGSGACPGCTVNAYALQGYLEARAATNNWALSRARVEETGLQYSITGHGLGGMHSLIASVDLGWSGVCRWSHNYGAPRTFNQAGASFYDRLFQGEAGERGVANRDAFVEMIPASSHYAFTGTAFLYTNYSEVYHMNMEACWDQPNSPDCAPRRPLDETSHYFYFANVGQCGQGRWQENRSLINSYLSSERRGLNASTSSPANFTTTTSHSSSVTSTTSSMSSSSITSSSSSVSPSTSTTSSASSSSASVPQGLVGQAAAETGSLAISSASSIHGSTTWLWTLVAAAALLTRALAS